MMEVMAPETELAAAPAPVVEFEYVPAPLVSQWWPKVRPWVKKAIERAPEDFIADDIGGYLVNSRAALWIIVVDKVLSGVIVTELLHFPRGRVLNIWLCGADDASMEAWGDYVEEKLTTHARECGCSGLEFKGRDGWTQRARKHNYKKLWTVFRKEIT